MNFKEIEFPGNLEYSSDEGRIPIEFYLEILPNSKTIYLKLGYFSSKAFQVLAYGFAQFVYNGGSIKIISNHFLYEDDANLLALKDGVGDDGEAPNENDYLIRDLEWLAQALSGEARHVFNCLKILVKMRRLEIIPVKLKPGRMAHYKQGIFIDGFENVVFMDGSCNFTANGLLENAENISLCRSWGEEIEARRVVSKRKNIEGILTRKNEAYEYLDAKDIVSSIETLGEEKSIEELLSDEIEVIGSSDKKNILNVIDKHKIILEQKIKAVRESPRFPFVQGPRDYQQEAYFNWVANAKKGIFAMATGTGKTITALNCVLEEYKKNGFYQAIILVPSKPLLSQWSAEVESFNFGNKYLVSSDYNWKGSVSELNTGLAFKKDQSFILICTYKTFATENFQKRITNFTRDTIFIADEAHNIGSEGMKVILPRLVYEKRLALSATPKRRFDEEGNALIEKFFYSTDPYTYSFSMERAISEGILCKYEYHPHVVYLESEEMIDYSVISKKLTKLYDRKVGGFRNTELAKMLLLERSRIIHKAGNKINTFSRILDSLKQERRSLKYTFVYVPEGEDKLGENLLNVYMKVMAERCGEVRSHHYTHISESRSEVMSSFEAGYIDVLFSMKCLDEGVDIPRAEIAIFCSSTGNPRQFIQRRGRVLRAHPDKKFAIVHDLVVAPLACANVKESAMETKLMRDELIRVVYFATLSKNYYDAMNSIKDVAESFGVDIFALECELREKS